MPEIAAPELVAKSFLSSQSVLSDYGVSTTLPRLTVPDGNNVQRDNWGGKTQWITITSLPSSPGGRTTPIRTTSVVIDCWAKPKRAGSPDVPWGAAAVVVQRIIELGTDWYTNVRLSITPSGYYPVSISNFAPGEASRVPGDPAGLARYSLVATLVYESIIS